MSMIAHKGSRLDVVIIIYLTTCIAVILFIIPFFWLKHGFVDLGGDAGRLYFIDPLFTAKLLISQENLNGVMQLSLLPYEYFLYLIKLIAGSSTYLIAVSNGLTLSIAFFFSYLSIRELLSVTEGKFRLYRDIAAFTGGIIYISFISNTGWSQALYSQNQIFLNPFLFYLLLRLCITSSMIYGLVFLAVTLIFSSNFGFGTMPQLMSFFPLSVLYIYFYTGWIAHRIFPWKKLFILTLSFFGLHAFHILPLVASTVDKTSVMNVAIFGRDVTESRGVKYFDANHIELGKISLQLFSPSAWRSQNILALLVPMIVVLGFLKTRSKLLLLTGVFFTVTLFLTSANITKIGVQFYRSLFYIPGFMMFRSFNDRWYYVYAFFYMLLFSFSFYEVTKRWKSKIVILASILVLTVVTYRIFPFLEGKALYAPLFQSNNVVPVLKLDPDMMEALEFARNLPQDGKFLTVPLTFPYYQIAYGKEGGAYRGISLVANLAGRQDYAGFWAFGPYEQAVFDALLKENMKTFLSLLDTLEVRYIFRNSDTRIMDDFPGYPYIYPGMTYSSKDQLPVIKDQKAYDELISKLPLKKVFEKGFYEVYELVDSPSYPQSTIEPVLHPYFVAGRVVSIATGIMIVIGIGIYVVKRYEKKK